MTEREPMRRSPWLLLAACTLAPATIGGCRGLRFLAYLFAPEAATKKVKPEYDKLPDSSVAVVVFADAKTQAEHRNIQLHLAAMVSQEIRERFQDEDVTVISSRRVVKYQRENLFWEEMDRTKLGKDLGAGYVLFISLDEFSTLEPGSLQLYRGRMVASARLYKTSLPARDARVWGPSEFRVTYPAEAATGTVGESDQTIRDRTLRIFTDRLVKKFYEHKADPPE